MCVGRGGVIVGEQKNGVLIFMGGDSGMDKEGYRIYRDEVLIPFIKDSRNNFGGWVEGQHISEEMMAVSWCDGDLV